jgi:NAD(P)-dependent dehydrogenase (short-subunit alcohol dehydrogenase family)
VKDLAGKVAVVTGAASGIGLAVATRLAGEGMRVVLADVEEAALATAAASLSADGAVATAVATDVADGASVEALRDAALSAFGAVHLVHNNAGVGCGGPLWTLTEDDWAWVLGVNLWGVIHGIRAFVPLLVEQGEGHVVNTASMAGLVSTPMMGPYNASKHAVVTISETLRLDLQQAGSPVAVSVLCPGFVQTRIHEAQRNRPGGPRGEPFSPGVIEHLVATGIPPAAVADAVLDAVTAERFWVLTHPGMKAVVEARMRAILDS